MTFISELNFRGTGVSDGEFIEITLAPGDDPADFTVSVYRNNGTLHTNAGIPGGEISLDQLTGTPHPDNPAYTVYVIPVGVRNAPSDSNEGSGIALTNTDTGEVISFYSADNINAFTATEGAASGATSEDFLEHTLTSPGESYQWDINGNLTYGSTTSSDSVLCLTGDTPLRTPQGMVPCQDLRVGHMVWTLDNGFQPLRWVGQDRLGPRDFLKAPKTRPVRIARGALGPGCPAADLVVSPQHRVLIRSAVARRMFGQDEVLIPAIHLCGLPGISVIETPGPVVYVHLLFDRHELLSANGAAVESLLLTAYSASLATSSPALPQVAHDPIRPLIKGRRARHMLGRIRANRKALQDPIRAAA